MANQSKLILTGDELCRCGHPEGEHTIKGDCAIHRRDRGRECGCVKYTLAVR